MQVVAAHPNALPAGKALLNLAVTPLPVVFPHHVRFDPFAAFHADRRGKSLFFQKFVQDRTRLAQPFQCFAKCVADYPDADRPFRQIRVDRFFRQTLDHDLLVVVPDGPEFASQDEGRRAKSQRQHYAQDDERARRVIFHGTFPAKPLLYSPHSFRWNTRQANAQGNRVKSVAAAPERWPFRPSPDKGRPGGVGSAEIGLSSMIARPPPSFPSCQGGARKPTRHRLG